MSYDLTISITAFELGDSSYLGPDMGIADI
jgi:hypothetical protein